jgi:prevent-host-death family protein
MRFHSKEILDAVSRGEEVVITFRGRPKAKIIPLRDIRPSKEAPARLFGIWKDHPGVDSVNGYIRKIRKGRFA